MTPLLALIHPLDEFTARHAAWGSLLGVSLGIPLVLLGLLIIRNTRPDLCPDGHMRRGEAAGALCIGLGALGLFAVALALQ